METIELQAETREKFGKNFTKQLRKSGFIPAVVYGLKSDPQHVQLNAREFGKIYRKYRDQSVLITLQAAGQEWSVISKDVVKDAITLDILHVDFQKIDVTKEVRAEVKLKMVGVAPGVKLGGNLRIKMDRVRILSLPHQIPNHIDIDLSVLGLDKSIRVRDIDTKGHYQILTTPEEIIVLVEAFKAQAEGAPSAA